MNESSNERQEDFRLNAEDLGWKKGFRWPKSFLYDGVEFHEGGILLEGLDGHNLNEHGYHSEDGTRTLSINRYRDRRKRWKYEFEDLRAFPSCPHCGVVHNRKAMRSFTCRKCRENFRFQYGQWEKVLTDGTTVPLIWDGTRGRVVDYRKYTSVGDYKDAVDATGLRFGICCAWPLDKFMRENHLTFPEAYELFTQGYEEAAARRGLYRTKDGKMIRKPVGGNTTLNPDLTPTGTKLKRDRSDKLAWGDGDASIIKPKKRKKP